MSDATTIGTGQAETRTVSALGYTWAFTDARTRDDNDSQSSRNVAHVFPIDPETGDRLTHVVIRGHRRYAGVIAISGWRRDESGYIRANSVTHELTESNVRELERVAVPVALELFPRLTQAQKVERVLAAAEQAGRNAASAAWRGLIDYGSDIRRDLTADDVAAIAAALAAGFAAKAAEGI